VSTRYSCLDTEGADQDKTLATPCSTPRCIVARPSYSRSRLKHLRTDIIATLFRLSFPHISLFALPLVHYHCADAVLLTLSSLPSPLGFGAEIYIAPAAPGLSATPPSAPFLAIISSSLDSLRGVRDASSSRTVFVSSLDFIVHLFYTLCDTRSLSSDSLRSRECRRTLTRGMAGALRCSSSLVNASFASAAA
jgi:hypothetical protein